jgi:hypothetical protein
VRKKNLQKENPPLKKSKYRLQKISVKRISKRKITFKKSA